MNVGVTSSKDNWKGFDLRIWRKHAFEEHTCKYCLFVDFPRESSIQKSSAKLIVLEGFNFISYIYGLVIEQIHN